MPKEEQTSRELKVSATMVALNCPTPFAFQRMQLWAVSIGIVKDIILMQSF